MGEKEKSKGRPKGKNAIIKHLIAGTSGGIGLAIVGHPFDTLKTLYQTQHGQLKENTRVWKSNGLVSPFGSRLKVPKLYLGENIFQIMYRGLTPPLLMSTAMCAITLGTYGVLHNDYGIGAVPAGSIAGFTAAILLNPFQLMKVQFQMGNQYLGPSTAKNQRQTFGQGAHWVIQQFKKHGILQIWKRGIFMTSARDIVGRGIYFGSYEAFKKHLSNRYESQWLVSWIAGGFTGIVTWSIMMPLDTIKSNIQATPFHQPTKTIGQVWKSMTIKRMYAGFIPAIMRSFPANAVSLLFYEYTSRFLSNLSN